MHRSKPWIAAALAIVLVACGGDEDDADSTAGTSSTAADTSASESGGTTDAGTGSAGDAGSSDDAGSTGSDASGSSDGSSSDGGVDLPPCDAANDQPACESNINCQWDPGPPGRGMCVWLCEIIPDEATCMQVELCTWDGSACVPA